MCPWTPTFSVATMALASSMTHSSLRPIDCCGSQLQSHRAELAPFLCRGCAFNTFASYGAQSSRCRFVVCANRLAQVYNGDSDPCVNSLATQDIYVNYLPGAAVPLTSPWRPWTTDGAQRMGGYVIEFAGGKFQYVTIRGSGHMVCALLLGMSVLASGCCVRYRNSREISQ